MSRPTAAVFSAIRAGFRSGKLPLAFAAFFVIGVAVGPDYTNSTIRQAEIEQQERCQPIVWQDAWTGTERENAWNLLIEQGYDLRVGTNVDLIIPPGCEAVHSTDTED